MSIEIVWLSWLALFLIYELAAVFAHKGGTLSEWTWRKFAVKSGRFSFLRRLVLLSFMSSLTIHLVWATTVRYVVVTGVMLMATIALSMWKER